MPPAKHSTKKHIPPTLKYTPDGYTWSVSDNICLYIAKFSQEDSGNITCENGVKWYSSIISPEPMFDKISCDIVPDSVKTKFDTMINSVLKNTKLAKSMYIKYKKSKNVGDIKAQNYITGKQFKMTDIYYDIFKMYASKQYRLNSRTGNYFDYKHYTQEIFRTRIWSDSVWIYPTTTPNWNTEMRIIMLSDGKQRNITSAK